jgi:hypothetical protein
MLQNVLIRIKEKNLLDGTRNKVQTRKATTPMRIVMAYQTVMKMNKVINISC